jgi:hypothetical protein
MFAHLEKISGIEARVSRKWSLWILFYGLSVMASAGQVSAATLTPSQQALIDSSILEMSQAQRDLIFSHISKMGNAELRSLEVIANSDPALLVSTLKGMVPPPAALQTSTPQTQQPLPTASVGQEGTLAQAEATRPATLTSSSATVPQSSDTSTNSRQERTEPYRVLSSTRSINAIDPFLRGLSNSRLKAAVSGYGIATPIDAQMDFRGLKISVTSLGGSTSMRLRASGTNIDITAALPSRDLSLLKIASYLTAEDGQLIGKLLRGVVANTVDDPVAGNPSSLLGRMLAMDFRAGTQSFMAPGELAQVSLGDFGSVSLLGWHQFGGSTVNTLSLPVTLGHAVTERWKVYVDAVPAFQQINGTPIFSSMLAAGFQALIYQDQDWRWISGAALRTGIAGSTQAEAVGGFFGGSVSSELQHQIQPGLRISGAVTLAHYTSLPIDFGPYSIRYDLSNTGVRTGAAVNYGLGTLYGLEADVSASVSDSRFSGTRLAVNSWQEYGAMLSLGKVTPIRAGIAYMHGERGVQGISLRASVSF